MASISDRDALDEIFSLVYEELRRLAGCVVRTEYACEISPTTLVNEVWLKLAGTPAAARSSPLHFRRIAGRAMRQVMVDAARRRQAEIHGGGFMRLPFEAIVDHREPVQDRDVLALDAALEVLHRRSPRQSLLVEARFFGGLSCAECAEMLGISEATVMREWRVARAWLACEIKRGTERPEVDNLASPRGA